MSFEEYDNLEINEENTQPKIPSWVLIRNKNDISDSKGRVKQSDYTMFLKQLENMSHSERNKLPKNASYIRKIRENESFKKGSSSDITKQDYVHSDIANTCQKSLF